MCHHLWLMLLRMELHHLWLQLHQGDNPHLSPLLCHKAYLLWGGTLFPLCGLLVLKAIHLPLLMLFGVTRISSRFKTVLRMRYASLMERTGLTSSMISNCWHKHVDCGDLFSIHHMVMQCHRMLSWFMNSVGTTPRSSRECINDAPRASSWTCDASLDMTMLHVTLGTFSVPSTNQ